MHHVIAVSATAILSFLSPTFALVSLFNGSNGNNGLNILYAGKPDQFREYEQSIRACLRLKPRLPLDLNDPQGNVRFIDGHRNVDSPESIDYILYNPKSGLSDFSSFTNLKALLNLRAGVEGVLDNPTIPASVPICRLVDPGLVDGMVEYVVGHVLRYHLQIDRRWDQQRAGDWDSTDAPPLASDRSIGILGMGTLGTACADALSNFNFRILGWSRRPKSSTIPGVTECYTGREGLESVLAAANILVCLLPDTPETMNVLNQETFQKCRRSVAIINVGRGSSIDDAALLEAIDSGIVEGATLDVFRQEPLPNDHPFWTHPQILVTPHVAAKIRPETAGQLLADNIERSELGKPLLFVVDRELGY